ncbi:hypothetical protein [Brevibacillus marinus]|uniref:hypothetical protein n=1 Tax=Brevibacillus marinus TaxID=2496837 RepID=UPI000F843C80|nr:hypothetical protein [Brevibacillus marinus]
MKKWWIFIALFLIIILFLSFYYIWGDVIKLSAKSDYWSATLTIDLTGGRVRPSPLTLQYIQDDLPIYIKSVDVDISSGQLSLNKQVHYSTPFKQEDKKFVVSFSENNENDNNYLYNKNEFIKLLSNNYVSIWWSDSNGQTYSETLNLKVLQ